MPRRIGGAERERNRMSRAIDTPMPSLSSTPQRDTLGESEVVVALFRTLLVAMVLIGPLVTGRDLGATFYFAVATAALYSVGATLLLYRGARFRYRRHLVLVIDIVLLTLLVYHFGGSRGELFPLFYLTVIIGAIWFNLLGAVTAAALTTLCYVLIVYLNVPPEEIRWQLRYLMLPHALLLFLVALLCGYLAEAWRAERARADAHRAIVDQFQRQMSMAQELQSLIQPAALPRIDGIELGMRSRQAAVVVGGDYYDGVAFPDGSLAVVVADVSGKSVPGQLRLPLVKYAFRVAAHEHKQPGAVMSRLSTLLYDELPSEMFVSMVYALVEPARGRVSLARAGHCPPLHLITATGEVVALQPRGAVLGVDRDLRFEVAELEFAPDDYLVLYSDGAIEARDRRGRELQIEGMVDMLRQAAPESAQDLANWLFHALDEYEVGAKRDDLTLLVIRRTAPQG